MVLPLPAGTIAAVEEEDEEEDDVLPSSCSELLFTPLPKVQPGPPNVRRIDDDKLRPVIGGMNPAPPTPRGTAYNGIDPIPF